MNHESLVEKYLGITNYHTEIPLPTISFRENSRGLTRSTYLIIHLSLRTRGDWVNFKIMADREGEEVDESSTTYTLDHFAEVEEVVTIIESVRTICHDYVLMEAAVERFTGKIM